MAHFEYCSEITPAFLSAMTPRQYLNSMLADRRDKLRKQIRTQILSRKFAMQRKALMKGVSSIFYELCAEMDQLTQSDTFELNAKLLACAEQYPQEENTYILIGNWLSRHPELFDYFQLHLTDTFRLSDNYVWSLAHLENIYLENCHKIADFQRRVRGIVVMITEMAREILARGCSLTKMAHLQDNYILILRRLLQKNFNLDQLAEAIHLALLFIDNIAEITPTTEAIQKEFSNEQLDNYLDFFLSLKEVNQWEFLRSHGLEAIWSRAFAITAVPILRNLPQSRQDCLRVLGYLLTHEKDIRLMDKTFFKELLNQLLFLIEEVPNLAPTILTQLKLMLDECQMSQLTQMLQMGVHIRLVRGIELAMQKCDNLLLQNCLAATFGLLTRLNLSEPKLMLRVKEDIENVNFHHMIEGLIQNDQNEIVDNLVNNIVDDFYSEQVSEPL